MKPAEICRTCLRQDVHFSLIYDYKKINEETLLITDLLRICCGIKASPSDELSPLVCYKCMIEICRAYSFRQQSLQANQFLQKRKERIKASISRPPPQTSSHLLYNRPTSNGNNLRKTLWQNPKSTTGRYDVNNLRVGKDNLELLKQKIKEETWSAEPSPAATVSVPIFKRESSYEDAATYAPSEWDMELDLGATSDDDMNPAGGETTNLRNSTSTVILQTISANRKREEEQKQREIDKRKCEIEKQRKDMEKDKKIKEESKQLVQKQTETTLMNEVMEDNVETDGSGWKTKVKQWTQQNSDAAVDSIPSDQIQEEIIEISHSPYNLIFQIGRPDVEIVDLQNADIDDMISVSEYGQDEDGIVEEEILPDIPEPTLSIASKSDLEPLTSVDLIDLLLDPKEAAEEPKESQSDNSNDEPPPPPPTQNQKTSKFDFSTKYDPIEPATERRCNICKLVLSSKRKLKYHMEVRHLKSKTYLCNYCGESFSTHDQSRGHIKLKHFPETLPKCKYCEKPFLSLFQVTMHERKHTGEKPFKCDLCDYAASQMSALKVHNRTHTGERPYKCEVCGASFRTASRKTEHMRSHRKNIEDGKYDCKICGKKNLWRRGALKLHMESHTIEKPFRCELCLKYFLTPKSLKRHYTTEHEGIELKDV